MCNVAVAALIISGISTAISAKQQHDNAESQEALLQEESDQLTIEQGAAASEEAGSRVQQARLESARRLVASGEAGVGGNSAGAELTNTIGDANRDVGTIAQHAIYGGIDTSLRARSEALGIRKPSAISAGLQIAGASMDGYSRGSQIDRARSGRKG